MREILLKNCNLAAEFKIIPMEFTGKIIAILPPRGGVSKTSGNEWKSQEYVIENHDQYPRKMCFDVFGADKIEQFNIQMGEELTVSFDVDARQWNDRWFNSIRAWKVERVRRSASSASVFRGYEGICSGWEDDVGLRGSNAYHRGQVRHAEYGRHPQGSPGIQKA